MKVTGGKTSSRGKKAIILSGEGIKNVTLDATLGGTAGRSDSTIPVKAATSKNGKDELRRYSYLHEKKKEDN